MRRPSGHCCRARAGTVAGPGRVGRPASEPAGGCLGGRSGGWVSGRAGGSVGTLSCSLIPFPSHSCPGHSKPLNPPRHATRPKPTPNSLILDFSCPTPKSSFPVLVTPNRYILPCPSSQREWPNSFSHLRTQQAALITHWSVTQANAVGPTYTRPKPMQRPWLYPTVGPTYTKPKPCFRQTSHPLLDLFDSKPPPDCFFLHKPRPP